MKKIVLFIICTFIFNDISAQTYKAYLFSDWDSVSIYNIATRARTSTISSGVNAPLSHATNSSDHKQVYFIIGSFFNNAHTIYSIDTENESIINSATTPNSSILKVSPDNKSIYLSYSYGLYKIDTGNLQVTETHTIAPVNSYTQTFNNFEFYNDSIVFFNGVSGKIYKYNLNSKITEDSIEGYTLALCGNKIATKTTLDSLRIYDAATLAVDTNIKLNSFIRLHNPKNNTLYVTSGDYKSLYELDVNTLIYTDSIELAYTINQVKLDPKGNLWVIHQQDKYISIVDTIDLSVTDDFSINFETRDLAFAIKSNTNNIVRFKANSHIKLYPSPATNKITLETGFNEVKNYTIINSLGKPVMSFERFGAETEVDVSTLPPGVYFVIPDGDKTQALKFIKQ